MNQLKTEGAQSERMNRAEPPQAMMGQGCASRQTGRSALLEAAERLRRRAEQIEALAHAIPENFPRDADAGLWELVMAAR